MKTIALRLTAREPAGWFNGQGVRTIPTAFPAPAALNPDPRKEAEREREQELGHDGANAGAG